MTARLSPQRETEIRERAEAATPGPWGVYDFGGGGLIEIAADLEETGHGYRARRGIARLDEEPLDNDPTHMEWTADEDWAQVEADAAFIAHVPADIAALLAELAAVRAERDAAHAELAKYVGKEPTVVEEMTYLRRCLNAVHDLCDEARRQAGRWENPLPVPEWVAPVEQAACGERSEDPSDRRRRIYIDGRGDAWISLSHDKNIRYVGRLAGAIPADDTTDSVREATGSLREIGRCW